MRVFLNAGFKLKEIIIKEQHNCKATGYWKTSSIKYNFLLLAHEYLFVFVKDAVKNNKKVKKERYTVIDNKTGETCNLDDLIIKGVL